MHGSRMTTEQVHRRAGGRRRYNKQRQAAALMRRLIVLRALYTDGCGWGTFSRLADELGVHRSTILRDVQRIFGQAGGAGRKA